MKRSLYLLPLFLRAEEIRPLERLIRRFGFEPTGFRPNALVEDWETVRSAIDAASLCLAVVGDRINLDWQLRFDRFERAHAYARDAGKIGTVLLRTKDRDDGYPNFLTSGQSESVERLLAALSGGSHLEWSEPRDFRRPLLDDFVTRWTDEGRAGQRPPALERKVTLHYVCREMFETSHRKIRLSWGAIFQHIWPELGSKRPERAIRQGLSRLMDPVPTDPWRDKSVRIYPADWELVMDRLHRVGALRKPAVPEPGPWWRDLEPGDARVHVIPLFLDRDEREELRQVVHEICGSVTGLGVWKKKGRQPLNAMIRRSDAFLLVVGRRSAGSVRLPDLDDLESEVEQAFRSGKPVWVFEYSGRAEKIEGTHDAKVRTAAGSDPGPRLARLLADPRKAGRITWSAKPALYNQILKRLVRHLRPEQWGAPLEGSVSVRWSCILLGVDQGRLTISWDEFLTHLGREIGPRNSFPYLAAIVRAHPRIPRPIPRLIFGNVCLNTTDTGEIAIQLLAAGYSRITMIPSFGLGRLRPSWCLTAKGLRRVRAVSAGLHVGS